MRGSGIRRIGSAAVAATLGLAACGGGRDARGADSSRAAAAPGAPRALVGARRVTRSYPGALTKPIDAYTGDELYELTRRLRFAGSHERQRRCRKAPDCEAGARGRRTLVQVSAVATQDSITAEGLPEFGVVYIRAINRGDAEEARYGLRPGRSLRYFVIVQRDSTGALRWRMEELDTTRPRRHASVGTGAFQGCGHSWTAGARADFKTCEAAASSDSVATLPLMFQLDRDPPIWASCAEGCCIL